MHTDHYKECVAPRCDSCAKARSSRSHLREACMKRRRDILKRSSMCCQRGPPRLNSWEAKMFLSVQRWRSCIDVLCKTPKGVRQHIDITKLYPQVSRSYCSFLCDCRTLSVTTINGTLHRSLHLLKEDVIECELGMMQMKVTCARKGEVDLFCVATLTVTWKVSAPLNGWDCGEPQIWNTRWHSKPWVQAKLR